MIASHGVRCSGEARPRHGARSFNELSGTFERDVDAETAPRQLCRITFAADCDPAAPDIDPILAGGELAREMPMDAIACEETCTGANQTKIIDGDELDFIAPCPMLEAQDQVTDAAKAINGNSSRHATLNCCLLAILHALNFNALIQVNGSHTAQLPRHFNERAVPGIMYNYRCKSMLVPFDEKSAIAAAPRGFAILEPINLSRPGGTA